MKRYASFRSSFDFCSLKVEELKRLVKRPYAIAVIIAAVAIVAAWYFLRAPFHIAPGTGGTQDVLAGAHFYRNSGISIENVVVKLFYAVPRNKVSSAYPQWKQVLEDAARKLSAFHKLQFRNTSSLRFDIFPRPVFLEHDNLFYDTVSTNFGNPHALIGVGEEIERRVFREGGDLYDGTFAVSAAHEYPVMGIVYEGVGAAGGVIWESGLGSLEEVAKELQIPKEMIFQVGIEGTDGFFLLNRQFLTDFSYKPYGATLLYHEFAHTLGVPDRYDASSQTDEAFSDDIMGGRRREPIEGNYLSAQLLKDLGVFK